MQSQRSREEWVAGKEEKQHECAIFNYLGPLIKEC
jgi:hypothetical protein